MGDCQIKGAEEGWYLTHMCHVIMESSAVIRMNTVAPKGADQRANTPYNADEHTHALVLLVPCIELAWWSVCRTPLAQRMG